MTDQTRSRLAAGLPVFLVMALLVVVINPLREMPLEDDWFYALTVKHLLDTGEYRLHEFAAANLPFQAYWGAAFCRVLGYSFASLRLATLALTVLGLGGMYVLAREHGFSRRGAWWTALGLISCPLVLRFSFNFMTDVPCLMTLTVALGAYSRALRQRSQGWMLAASVAGAACILVRQFGMALLPGLVVVWLADGDRRRYVLLYATGLALPVLATAWQLWMGLGAANWGANYMLYHTREYWSRPEALAYAWCWRPLILLLYLSFFALPFVLGGLWQCARDRHGRATLVAWTVTVGVGMATYALVPAVASERGPVVAVVLGALGLGVLAGTWVAHRALRWPLVMAYSGWRPRCGFKLALAAGTVVYFGYVLYRSGREGRFAALPYTGFNYEYLLAIRPLAVGLTLLAVAGAVWVGAALVGRYWPWRTWWHGPPAEKLLDAASLFFALELMLFCFFGDEYMLPLLPFAIIVLGRSIKDSWEHWLPRAVYLGGCALALLLGTMETRAVMEYDGAMWQAGNRAAAIAGRPDAVYHANRDTGYRYWMLYYTTFFGDWLVASGYAATPTPQLAWQAYDEPWTRLEATYASQATYFVTDSPDPRHWQSRACVEPNVQPAAYAWQEEARVGYRDFWGRRRFIYIMHRGERRPAAPAPAGAGT